MISLRRNSSADQSTSGVGIDARSLEFSVKPSRSIVGLLGLSLSLLVCLLSVRLALTETLTAVLAHSPVKNLISQMISGSLLLIAPGSLLMPFLQSRFKYFSAKRQIFFCVAIQSVVLSFASALLRFNIDTAVILLGVMCVLALTTIFYCVGLIRWSLELGTQSSWHRAIAVIILVNVLSLSLPLGLCLGILQSVFPLIVSLPQVFEICATICLLSGFAAWAFGQIVDAHSSGNSGIPDSRIPWPRIKHIMPFLIPAYCTSTALLTMLLFAVEHTSALSRNLVQFAEITSFGCLIGTLIAFLPLPNKWKFSQFILPSVLAMAASFVAVVDPGGNHLVNTNLALILFGATFVYSNMQFLARLQKLFKPSALPAIHAGLIASIGLTVSISLVLVQPLLDTISATMLIRFFGLQIIIVGSILLIIKLLWDATEIHSAPKP